MNALRQIFWRVVRFLDLAWREAASLLLANRPETWLFRLETALLAAALALSSSGRIRSGPPAVLGCALLTVAGFLTNRLNVSVTGLEAASGARYFPSWMEVAVTLSIVTLGLLVFRFAVRHLAVWGRPTVCVR
jgi:Ni/Fe-hydrogenase subunit HybB-like protein